MFVSYRHLTNAQTSQFASTIYTDWLQRRAKPLIYECGGPQQRRSFRNVVTSSQKTWYFLKRRSQIFLTISEVPRSSSQETWFFQDVVRITKKGVTKKGLPEKLFDFKFHQKKLWASRVVKLRDKDCLELNKRFESVQNHEKIDQFGLKIGIKIKSKYR